MVQKFIYVGIYIYLSYKIKSTSISAAEWLFYITFTLKIIFTDKNMSPPSKKLSGAQNLKRKRIKQVETEKSANLLSKFLRVEKLPDTLSPERQYQQAIEDPLEKALIMKIYSRIVKKI